MMVNRQLNYTPDGN